MSSVSVGWRHWEKREASIGRQPPPTSLPALHSPCHLCHPLNTARWIWNPLSCQRITHSWAVGALVVQGWVNPRALMGWTRDKLSGWALVGDNCSPEYAFGRQDRLLLSSCFLPTLSLPLGWKMRWPYNYFPLTWSPAQNQSPIETGSICFGLTFGPRCQTLLCGTETQGLSLSEARCPAL